jgi:hypothetical protein
MEEHGACVFRLEELNSRNLYMKAAFSSKISCPRRLYLQILKAFSILACISEASRNTPF